MESNEMMREEISAFADGELTQPRIDGVASRLRQPAERARWDAYHQIGDILRSDDMAISLSEGFSARMSARLELEPSFLLPQVGMQSDVTRLPRRRSALVSAVFGAGRRRRFIVPGIAAAAAVAYLGIPQLMVASYSSRDKPAIQLALQSVGKGSDASVTGAAGAGESASGAVVVLRDAQIDEYVLAHQRFSSSLYSGAQYARPATFATDTGK